MKECAVHNDKDGKSGPWHRAVLLMATGFGLGLSPVASGTAGTVPGLFIAWALAYAAVGWQIAAGAILAAAAIPVCDLAERHFGRKDDGRIVADEYLTFPLCVIGLPIVSEPWILAVAFVTNRAFDVIKPFPARRLQKLPGGLGIVADDVFSSLYALAANHLIFRLFHFFAS